MMGLRYPWEREEMQSVRFSQNISNWIRILSERGGWYDILSLLLLIG